jgi:hypothetical protein
MADLGLDGTCVWRQTFYQSESAFLLNIRNLLRLTDRTMLHLKRDTKRFGSPLRAVCFSCDRLTYRLYLFNGWFQCGKCLQVTYASGQGDQRDRALARLQRLEHRLTCTEWLPRHRGRSRILAEIDRQDARLFSTMPTTLLRSLTRFAKD